MSIKKKPEEIIFKKDCLIINGKEVKEVGKNYQIVSRLKATTKTRRESDEPCVWYYEAEFCNPPKHRTSVDTKVLLCFDSMNDYNQHRGNEIIRIMNDHVLKLDHPNVLKYFDFFDFHGYFVSVGEFFEGQSLFNFIVDHSPISENRCRFLFQQLISGIEYLHNSMIVHRDIKPENIRVSDCGWYLKISEFDLIGILEESKNFLLHDSFGSPNYVSPEILSCPRSYDESVDIWNAGCVLFTLFECFLPYDDTTVRKIFKKIKTGQFLKPKIMTEQPLDLFKKTMIVDPKKRITIKEIKKHPWIRNALEDYIPQKIHRVKFLKSLKMEKERNRRVVGLISGEQQQEHFEKVIKTTQEKQTENQPGGEEDHKRKIMGVGGFGVVFEGRILCAIKEITLSGGFTLEDLKNEYKAQVCLDHKNVVKVFSYKKVSDSVVQISMEKMKCSLKKLIQTSSSRTPITVSKKLDFMKQMVQAVHYLHHETNPPVIHRDIKAENFLVSDEEDTIKICDFGFAREKKDPLESKVLTQRQVGTLLWMAPEILRPEVLLQFDQKLRERYGKKEKNILKKKKETRIVDDEEEEGESEEEEETEAMPVVYSFASDIYALALTFYEILYERYPFADKDGILPVDNWIRINIGGGKNIRPKFEDPVFPEGGCWNKLRDLIKRMWKTNPKKRIDTKTILKWFDENEEALIEEFGDKKFPSDFLK